MKVVRCTNNLWLLFSISILLQINDQFLAISLIILIEVVFVVITRSLQYHGSKREKIAITATTTTFTLILTITIMLDIYEKNNNFELPVSHLKKIKIQLHPRKFKLWWYLIYYQNLALCPRVISSWPLDKHGCTGDQRPYERLNGHPLMTRLSVTVQ